jgi:hypothetical protein
MVQTERAAGRFDKPRRGPPVCSVHGGHDLARRLMLVRGAVSDWGAPGRMPGFFLDCATARKRESAILPAPTLSQRHSSLGQRRRLTVEELSPGHVCRGFFHCNADMVLLCCRKAATKRARLLCAAADASSLLVHPQCQPLPKRLPSPGSALAGAVFLAAAQLLRRAGGRSVQSQIGNFF